MSDRHSAHNLELSAARNAPGPTFWPSCGWIIRSYFSRPLFLAVGAFGLLVVCLTWLDARTGMINPRAGTRFIAPAPPRAKVPVTSEERLQKIRAIHREQEVDMVNLTSLWTTSEMKRLEAEPPATRQYRVPDAGFYRILREFPHLRTLDFTSFDRTTGMDEVARLTGLEYLKISSMPPELPQLAALKNLRWIQFDFPQLPRDIQALETLPNLETVIISYRDSVSPAVLADLAKLPHLKTLALNLVGGLSSDRPPLTAERLAVLRDAPSLVKLYLGGVSSTEDVELRALTQQVLPGVEVVPAVTSERLYGMHVIHVFGFMVLSLLIGVQLSTQMRSPLRKLASGYATRHALVAAAAALLVVVACWLRMIKLNSNPLASLALTIALVAGGIGTTSVSSLAGVIQLSRVQRLFGVPVLLLVGLLGLLFVPSTAEILLSGRDPRVVAGLFVAAIVAIGQTSWILSQLVYWNSSLPAISPRNNFKPLHQGGQFRSSWMFATADREDQIEALRAARTLSWWERVARWRIGNPPLRMVRFALFMIATMMLGPLCVLWFGQKDSAAFASQFRIMPAMALWAISFNIAGMWRVRMLSLSLEMLYPIDRRRMQREMIAAFVLDMFPSLLVVAAIVALLGNIDEDLQIAWVWLPLDFLVLLPVGLLVMLGLNSVVVVICRMWLAFTVALAIVLVMIVCYSGALAVVMSWAGLGPSEMTFHRFESLLWIPALVGGIVAWVMSRRWLNQEPALRV